MMKPFSLGTFRCPKLELFQSHPRFLSGFMILYKKKPCCVWEGLWLSVLFYWSRIMWTSKEWDREERWILFETHRCAQSMERGEVKQRETDIVGESVCTAPASPDKTTELRVLLWNDERLHFNGECVKQSSSPRVSWGPACCSTSDGWISEGSMIPLIASLKPFVRTEWWWSGSIRAATKPQGAAEGQDLRN